MAYIIDLPSFKDKRGNLTVIEKSIPFDIRRIFYLYGVDKSVRGGHRHKKTIQAAICIQGSCNIHYNNGKDAPASLVLNRPVQCLVIEPADWHSIDGFSDKAILMVLASEYFDEKDYIFEPYSAAADNNQ
jgi:dTDP-4-dehydrorhamnose 3,5-epimerase-like enzyme